MENEARKVGSKINEKKMKYILNSRRIRRDTVGQNITIDNYNFERVTEFKYIGAVITADNNIDNKTIHSKWNQMLLSHSSALV